MGKILLIFGTRPEFIKLVPVIYEFQKRGLRNKLIVVHSNQHSSLLKTILPEFNVKIDYTLNMNNNSNN